MQQRIQAFSQDGFRVTHRQDLDLRATDLAGGTVVERFRLGHRGPEVAVGVVGKWVSVEACPG